MRLVGVIAEYNPFHLGHAHHLREARRRAQADAVVVVMSTAFCQRGSAAVCSPNARARMALACGADAVFALPAMWAVRDAEHFALGGAALLKGLGCSAISFGSEVDDLPLLRRCAEMMEHPDAQLQSAIRRELDAGLPYPAALSRAVGTLHPECMPIVSNPNSTLALCYLRAMLRLNAAMDVVCIPRQGAYHATGLGDAPPSATAVRAAIQQGDWAKVQSAMPQEAFAILKQEALMGRIHRADALDGALAYRLRTMDEQEYLKLPDISEGIEYRLMDAASRFAARENILQAAKTRRYPYARLSRLAAHALLGLTDADLNDAVPDAALLLGFGKDRADVLRHISREGTLPIISKAADAADSAWMQLERRAMDLWALGAALPSGLLMTQGVCRV